VADCTRVAHERGKGWTVLVRLMIGPVADCTGVAHDRDEWLTVLVWLMIEVRAGLYWCGS
jgi:hypothetical protein